MKYHATEIEALQKRNTEIAKDQLTSAYDVAEIYYRQKGKKGIRAHLKEKFPMLGRKELTLVIGYWDTYFS